MSTRRLLLASVALALLFQLPAPEARGAGAQAVVPDEARDAISYSSGDAATPHAVPDFRQGSWTLQGSDQPWGQDPVGGEAGSAMWEDGCAVTAVADVLAYYGTDLADGYGAIDPGALNRWLTDRSGFWPGGDIRWSSAADASTGAVSGGTAGDMLPPDRGLLDAELDAGRPVILQVVGRSGSTHYVVATARSGDTYLINDPGGLEHTLSGYGDSFYQMILFRPRTAATTATQSGLQDGGG